MLAYYYPQGKQRWIDGLTETDSYKMWEVHVRPRRGARRGFGEVHVRPRRGARRGFTTTERALRVSVSACLRKRTTINWALGVKSVGVCVCVCESEFARVCVCV